MKNLSPAMACIPLGHPSSVDAEPLGETGEALVDSEGFECPAARSRLSATVATTATQATNAIPPNPSNPFRQRARLVRLRSDRCSREPRLGRTLVIDGDGVRHSGDENIDVTAASNALQKSPARA